MGKLRVARISSVANEPVGLGVSRPSGSRRKPILVHGYSVSPRGANFAADVSCSLFNNYGGASAELVQSGDFSPTLAAAVYTSDFSVGADSWADLGGGNPTISGNATVGGVTQCLKVLAVGNDACSIKRPTTVSNGVMYKMIFDYFMETGSGVVALGLGDDGDTWDLGFDHDSGKHLTVVENAWQTDQVLFGLSDATDLELCGFTAINNQTRDTLVDTKELYLKNVVVQQVSNDGHWTRAADAEGYWDMKDESINYDASAADTTTYAGSNKAVQIDAIYTCEATVTFVAGDLWLTCGGITFQDMDATGIYKVSFIPSAATVLVLNGDGTGDGDFDNISLKRENKYNGQPLTLADAVYKNTIRSAVLKADPITFPKPVSCEDGWFMYFTTAGASCIMDINVFYEHL